MPRVTINGRSADVPAGTNLIEAARRVGILIPHFCYHPRLSVVGQCRQCLVEVEKAPKLVTACSTVATDGMVVHTDTPKAKEGARSVLEFELINHPKDCPICDQAGECYLQDYYMETGLYASEMGDPKNLKHKAVDLGAGIKLDTERCILCTRCVRFMKEVAGTGELTVLNRGDRSEIAVAPGHELASLYSGNIVDLCPVGALTSEDFRFRKRVWFLHSTPSICTGCSLGCNVHLDHEGGILYRIRPRENPEVNLSWMCDLGRQTYKEVHAGERIHHPLVREGGSWRAVAWDEALRRAAEGLAAAAREAPGAALVAGSPRASIEDHWALRALSLKALGGGAPFTGLPAADRSEPDGLLLQAERVPNWPGLALAGLADPGRNLEALASALRGGKTRALLLLESGERSNLAGEAAEAIEGVPFVVVLATHFEPEAAGRAHVVLPVASWAEREGSFVNLRGRLQRTRPAFPPPREAAPAWEAVGRILRRLGQDPGWTNAEAVFREAAAFLAPLSGLTLAAAGFQGVPLAGSKGAAAA